ncbi:hypothetical protein HMPREF1981_00182 [Bacteroides pyogenes F0041]|uniref:Uncharacterized protein n=1 Tax=Bacteroides pyogenes F0041 TaxID=1321819 RepID=U2E8K5_9BACE|nr:hypothetical protein HMPREF1981_00182 [Bacteroides pyogenes F0041]
MWNCFYLFFYYGRGFFGEVFVQKKGEFRQNQAKLLSNGRTIS